MNTEPDNKNANGFKGIDKKNSLRTDFPETWYVYVKLDGKTFLFVYFFFSIKALVFEIIGKFQFLIAIFL